MKTVVETELNLYTGTRKSYIGRFLGFLREEEWAKTLGNPEITSRIETRPSQSLIACCKKVNENNWGLKGIRFVLSIKESGGKPAIIKFLLISDKLNYISEMKPDTREVVFVTMKGEHIFMKEKEVTA